MERMMKKWLLLAVSSLLVLALPIGGHAQAGGRAAGPPPYRVSLRAMLFYTDKGTFSPDLIANPVDLWNTPAGEGRAGGASNATLVVAVVRGEAGSYVPTRKVELTVTAGGREVFKRAEEPGILNTEGRTYVAFWLYDTGCRRLRLSARILGQTASTPVTATISFACGE
jgi:hypothetical protein